jgi:hypothetical protein
MKTTFDLPVDLVQDIKLHAVYEGREITDVATDLLKKGLEQSAAVRSTHSSSPKFVIQENGLPLVICSKNAPASKMSTTEILSLEHQTQTESDLSTLKDSQ